MRGAPPRSGELHRQRGAGAGLRRSAGPPRTPPTPIRRPMASNTDIVRGVFEAFSRRDLAALLDLADPGIVFVPPTGRLAGRTGRSADTRARGLPRRRRARLGGAALRAGGVPRARRRPRRLHRARLRVGRRARDRRAGGLGLAGAGRARRRGPRVREPPRRLPRPRGCPGRRRAGDPSPRQPLSVLATAAPMRRFLEIEHGDARYAIVRLFEAFVYDGAAVGIRGDIDRLREVEAALLGIAPPRGRGIGRFASTPPRTTSRRAASAREASRRRPPTP